MESIGTLAGAGVLAAVVALGMPAPATGQYVEVPRPSAYALEGVTVVHADGRRLEGATVVVRGSLIEAVGRGGGVPADARVLEGEDLVVYPGFVDANGKAEHAFPAVEIDLGEVEIWNAPRELQGFMPSRRLVLYLTADGEDVAAQRRAGIVAAAVHPTGAMMPGRGALVLYRQGVEEPEALVVDPALGPKFELRGGPGVYPGTLFGVMAFIRQAFEDARHGEAVASAHARRPEGMTMPPYDPDREVLQQVLAGELPVYFEADAAVDILRVVGLADEYGFRPVIVGGREAWKVADELRRRSIPVLVDVDFPEPRRYEPEAADTATEPLDAAALRERRELEDGYANAGRLAAAGVTFALTSGGKGALLEGTRKAVEHGLAEDAALAALTRVPAELLGIPHLARLEPGLPATFVVTRGGAFVEDAEVAYTFVEGRVEEGKSGGPEAGDPAEAVSFGGEWRMTIDRDGEIIPATLRIEQDGATFSGTLRMQGQDLEVRQGVINGNAVSMVALMEQGGQTLEIEVTGTVEGDDASGEADAGPLGMARWTATRTGPGGAR